MKRVEKPSRNSRLVVGLVLPFLAGLAAVAPARAPTAGPAAAADDREVSAGRWDVVAVEWEGRHLDEEWLARLQVIYHPDGSWAVYLRRIPVSEGRSTSRQDVSPKTFEMETLGSEGIKPSRFHGIYRLDGNTRVLCIAREGTPRPDEFSAPRQSGRMLVTLERAKDQAAHGGLTGGLRRLRQAAAPLPRRGRPGSSSAAAVRLPPPTPNSGSWRPPRASD